MAPIDIDVLLGQRPRFLSFVRARVTDRAEAEDLLQSAYARVLERGADVPQDDRVVPWFYRVLRNAIVDRHRRVDALERRRSAWERDPTRVATVPSGRLCYCTRKALASLNPRYAHIIEAVEIEGLAVSDVARRLSMSPGTTSVRLHRARRLLAERLIAICQRCAEGACTDCHCPGPEV